MSQIIALFIFLMITCTCSAVSDLLHPQPKMNPNSHRSDVTGIKKLPNPSEAFAQEAVPVNDISNIDSYDSAIEMRRKKRAVLSAVMKGVKAVSFLLRDAKEVDTIQTLGRKYVKSGGRDRQDKDFGSLATDAIIQSNKMANGGTRTVCTVGDRVIITKTRGERGKPTLEIFMARDILARKANRKKLSELEHYIITYIYRYSRN